MLLILLVACQSDAARGPITKTGSKSVPLRTTPLGAGYEAGDAWFDIYFTNPASPLASQYSGGVDGPLASAIDRARLSVDVAAYRFDSFPLRRALLRASDRGVRVRLVVEANESDSSDIQALGAAGVPIVPDGPDGLMHNKFMILDGREVWTGSMNFTASGTYHDSNNMVRLISPELAAAYVGEFEEMFLDRRFGPDFVPSTTPTRTMIGDTQVTVYFSPDDGIATELDDLIRGATESVNFLAFSFTSDVLGKAMRDRAAAGVTVRGVMDADQAVSNQGTEYDEFRQASLDVYKDSLEGQMHQKVLIIDEEIVVTGSYNFSASAEYRNDENILVIRDARIAAVYLAEFWRIYEAARQ